jgi:4-hydroxybenzoyl-CoA thioesterase
VNFVNRRQLTIEWGHCDPASLVFHTRYFEFADWSTALLFEAALGLTKPEMKKKYDAEMPLVNARGSFTKPLRLADVVEISSRVQAFKQSSFDVAHQFFNRGELVAEVKETRVWVKLDPSDPCKLYPKRVPEDVIERLMS